ncbi:inner membrane CreD family protein [Enterovibrio sp. 27052020O]|uniref:inner membrane CreD family protein n=1 Tax=Enterovibrio sp. 27052020O TaxID=3241166 RepID=UPI00388FBF6E
MESTLWLPRATSPSYPLGLKGEVKEVSERRTRRYDEVVILRATLDLKAGLTHDFRTRGIYQSLVYQSTIEVRQCT